MNLLKLIQLFDDRLGEKVMYVAQDFDPSGWFSTPVQAMLVFIKVQMLLSPLLILLMALKISKPTSRLITLQLASVSGFMSVSTIGIFLGALNLLTS